jgi:hypothetical protein
MCEVIDLGNGCTAMVCNCIKTDHECNDDNILLLLKDGNRVSATDENRNKYHEEIVGGSVACSICGRAAIDSAPFF